MPQRVPIAPDRGHTTGGTLPIARAADIASSGGQFKDQLINFGNAIKAL